MPWSNVFVDKLMSASGIDNSEAPKARRPLPTPGALPAAPRPDTPLVNTSAVPATSFYASSKPPPLPSRPRNPGSSHTSYVAPSQDPPPYASSPGFREPELVVEEPVQVEADMAPNPFPPAEQTWDNTTSYNGWHNETTTWGAGVTGWQNTTSSDWASGGNSTGNTDFDSMDYLGSSRLDQEFTIDGRVSQEETLWWNTEERERCQRPGPGILAPVLVEDLHDSNHLLYSVIITGLPPIQTTSLKDGASSSLLSASSSSSDSPLPSESEARMAIPHPNAYYCPKDNGWVILSWKSSSVSPPLARSYVHASNSLLPDQSRRRRTSSCLEDSGQPFGKANRTHHFHKYERAIDSHKLTPPFRKDEWENLRQKRRTGTVMSNDLDITSIDPNSVDSIDEIGETTPGEEEGKLLDLYVCCQCSFYCVASGVIPGVISKKCMDELQRDKKGHPIVGRTPEQTIVQTAETILTWVSSCGSDSRI